MREILFRGKRVDNGEWIEGMLFNGKEDTFIIPHGNEYSYDEQEGLSFDVYGCKVDPETVGQYTGLTDKNGKKIFEGDIVNLKGNPAYPSWGFVDYNALVVYSDGAFSAIDGTEENHGLRRYNFTRAELDVEVIGNIHDNPELLEVKAVQSSI